MSGEAITVIGEALIDLVPADAAGTYTAFPGGSPYNVAVGLARLGHPTSLMARLAATALGRILRERAEAEGIDLAAAPSAAEPATLAVVSLDAQARASYDFYREGTADWQWTERECDRAPERTAVLHFGSLASWTPPGDQHILGLAARLRGLGDVLVSYDPNVRPGLLGDPSHGRTLVERGVRTAHLVKASQEDIAWLYPGLPAARVAGRWISLGAAVVVITDGADGATAFTASGQTIHRPALPIAVADTVGAGDSFTAGLIDSLIRRRRSVPDSLTRCPEAELAAAVADAIAVAALNCQRAGNDPPTRADVESLAGR